MNFPVVDYDSHPAFADLQSPYAYDDGLIAQNVATIDGIHARFVASPKAQDVAPTLDEILRRMRTIGEHVKDVHASIIVREWLGSTFEWVLSDLRYEYSRLSLASTDLDDSKLDPAAQDQLKALRETGMYIVDLEERTFGDIRRHAHAELPNLRKRLDEKLNARAVYNLSRVSPFGRAVQSALTDAGVFDVLTHFKRNKMRVLGTGMEYSRAGQSWYKGIYSDLGLSDSPLRYLHVDEADHLPKAMIYATPVSTENGPTRVIPGSNRWHRSEFLFRTHKGLDVVTIGRYRKYVEGSEYRAPLRSHELRRVFMQLPRAFRGTSHLGDDIVAGSDLAQELAPLETQFLAGDRGRAMVFDGPRVLHRGAMVENGERLAMQVAFKNANDGRVQDSVRGGGSLRRLIKRARQLAGFALQG